LERFGGPMGDARQEAGRRGAGPAGRSGALLTSSPVSAASLEGVFEKLAAGGRFGGLPGGDGGRKGEFRAWMAAVGFRKSPRFWSRKQVCENPGLLAVEVLF
jgi:hypothetical protein